MKNLLGLLLVLSLVISCSTLEKGDAYNGQNGKVETAVGQHGMEKGGFSNEPNEKLVSPNKEVVKQNKRIVQPSNAQEAFPTENLTKPSIEVIFEQNGKLIKPSNGTITLDKIAFNIIFNLPKPMAVMVNASFNDKLLRMASEGKSLATRTEFSIGYMIAVGLFNPEKVLYVSEEASSPYFYENEEEYNFSTIELENGNYRCTRRIENIMDIDAERTVKVENIDAPIYLVFVPDSNDENPIGEIKMQTKYLKIQWSEEQHPTMEDTSFEPEDLSHLEISAKNLALLNSAIKQLDLKKSKVHPDFIVAKVRPHNPKETILVIPETVEEEEGFLELGSHILIVDTETGKIIHQYYEPSSWQSDAVILSKITIDTAPYNVSENNRAFGIRANYHTLSQPNPYANTTISLFVKSEDTLKEVLKVYDVMDFHGRWDTRCDGESTGHEKTLIMTNKKTNGYYDILVNDEITYTSTFMGRDEECNSTQSLSTKKTVLKFNGEEYIEKDTF